MNTYQQGSKLQRTYNFENKEYYNTYLIYIPESLMCITMSLPSLHWEQHSPSGT